MGYILLHDQEFERLEKQSSYRMYDYHEELQGLEVQKGALILDAGCGSGVVSRYLAQQYPSSRVVACDYTDSLLVQARDVARDIPNLIFEEQNLKHLKYPGDHFDLIVSRFVFHLQDSESLQKMITELVRVLKPGGTLVVIDIDGFKFNLYPTTPRIQEGLQKFATAREVDEHVGRKLPFLLAEAGLVSVSWRLETLEFQGTDKENELELTYERFRNAAVFYETVLGGEQERKAFISDFLECLNHPQSVFFYHKFIVSAMKPE